MKKFLVTYHAPADAAAQMATATPEQQAEGMKMWTDWFAKVGSHVVDMGAPLANSQAQNAQGSFGPSSKEFSGYTILQAESIEEAKSLLQGHPHTSGWNQQASLEIHEVMPIPGM